MDLVENPDQALSLETATRIMLHGMRGGIFSYGNNLAAHLSPGRKDYYVTRKIINGSDRASIFQFYAEKFEGILVRMKK